MRLSNKFSRGLFTVLLVVLVLLIPVIPVLAADVTDVALSVTSGPPGTAVTITGSGFTATTFSVTFGSTPVIISGSVTGGAISAAFIVPNLPRNTYNVTVTATGDTVNTPTFTIIPAVALDNSSGKVGDVVTVRGNGFAAGSNVTIYFDSTSITSVSSNSSGVIPDTVITIPQTRAGWHTISGQDYVGASLGTSYIVSPKIVLSSTTVTAGSTFTCSGSGFAYSSDISFYLDDDLMSGGTTTGTNGSFSTVTLTLPAVSGGTHELEARDESGNYATVDITVSSVISVSPNSGLAGTNVTISGSGFRINRSINITYDGENITTSPSAVTSGSDGKFTASFVTPIGPGGVHTIIANDGVNSSTTHFSTLSTATVNPTSGVVGTTITATGAGFKASAPLIITFDGTQVGLDATDAAGNFSLAFQAPSGRTGTHQIIVTDQSNTKQFSFTISPAISIDPADGDVGSDVNISGNGFGSQKGITVKYDVAQVAVTTTDNSGTFTTMFKAPVSEGGDHVITISDGTSTLTTTFTMDSTAPSIPEALLPETLTKAEKELTFNWEEVDDPSGVTYTLQIATDETFSVLVLEKENLSNTAYTLTEEERDLESVSKKSPYYWRVRATDAASNESEWSVPSTFYVGLVIPQWVLYVIFGVVAILCGVGGFFLGILWCRQRY